MCFTFAFFHKLAIVKTHRLRSVEIELFVQFIRHFANAFSVIRHRNRTLVIKKKL